MWLKMGKWVIKCSLNVFMNPWSVKNNKTYSLRRCTEWMRRREWAFSQGHHENSWAERRELGLLSDCREWASTNLASEGRDGGSWASGNRVYWAKV